MKPEIAGAMKVIKRLGYLPKKDDNEWNFTSCARLLISIYGALRIAYSIAAALPFSIANPANTYTVFMPIWRSLVDIVCKNSLQSLKSQPHALLRLAQRRKPFKIKPWTA